MALKVSLKCDKGKVRAINEDMILVSGEMYRDCEDEFSTIIHDNGRFVAAVADGMGGHNAGEIASEIAISLFDNFIVNLPTNLSDRDFRYELDIKIKEIHNYISAYGGDHPECAGMGTTLAAWLTYENRIYIINVGDSRVYRLRNGILYQLTKDHSMRNKSKDQSIPSNLIYNCFGGGGDYVFADVTNQSSRVLSGDTFLLCSDGIHDMLTDDEIEESLRVNLHSSSLVEKANRMGGQDNISVIVLTVK